MPAVLEEICAAKRAHVAQSKTKLSIQDLEEGIKQASAPRGFFSALEKKKTSKDYGLICEIKKASPSKGLIRPDFNPVAHAKDYEAAGAACLSILTDKPYFQGDDQFLIDARRTVSLPCLRKDFMIDPYQIYESRALGADCILLILAALDKSLATELESVALELGMDVLIEVHDAEEMKRALTMKSPLLGVNNRNLKTMEVSTQNTLDLAPMAGSDRLCVGESGLATHQDLIDCEKANVSTFLIGETFMRQDNIIQAVHTMVGK
ncbi:indole-3-glycerol phosphate synthase TrpC [Temperatibacter marinus]|uniref:Indole-3-glycerol phosphate synthase n=1 Tax=Temperatibacter marinus TaxID=1456591 RepID=A0AA52EBM5_9PROT|nr:indole-3-glycerol phosphate synthase TrpC [Temperatibacter marinus]WND02372.1 indole-3-glycerol phosphate synthase TrpC [Temperatibacter marinus]